MSISFGDFIVYGLAFVFTVGVGFFLFKKISAHQKNKKSSMK